MTRPDPLREMAEQIAAFFDPDPTGFQMDETLKRLRTAHRQGQEIMRERAAKVAEETGNECLNCLDEVAKAIRALSLDEPETEGGV